MDTFFNVSDSTIELPAEGNLGTRVLAPGDSFFGSPFYDNYVSMGLLAKASAEIITQRGYVTSDDIDETADPARYKAKSGSAGELHTFNVTSTAGDAFADTELDLLTELGGPGQFVQITTNQDVKIRINENTNSDFTLAAGETQVYNPGDIDIETLQFDSSFSGASTATIVVQSSTSNVPSSLGQLKYTMSFAFNAVKGDPVFVTYYFYTDQNNANKPTHTISRIEELGTSWAFPTWASLPTTFPNLSPQDQKSALLSTA